jgi:3-dehydroquinate synthetase
MTLDKKVSGGEIKFVLAERIGKVLWGQRVPMVSVQRALDPVAALPPP